MKHPVLSLYYDVMIYFYTYFLQICIRWRFWFERKPHQIDRSSDVYGNELGMRVQVSEVALFHILLDLIWKKKYKRQSYDLVLYVMIYRKVLFCIFILAEVFFY